MSRDAWKRYGQGGSWFYEVVRPGFKCNMTDIQASLGLHQLTRLAELQDRRHAVVKVYEEGFADLDSIEVPMELPGFRSAWHLYPIRLHLDRLNIDRSAFIDELGPTQHRNKRSFHPCPHAPLLPGSLRLQGDGLSSCVGRVPTTHQPAAEPAHDNGRRSRCRRCCPRNRQHQRNRLMTDRHKSDPYRSKRALDIAAAAVGLLIASPVMAAIAIGVRTTSSGPAISPRLESWTERQTIHAVQVPLDASIARRLSGTLITAAGDDRITRMGTISPFDKARRASTTRQRVARRHEHRRARAPRTRGTSSRYTADQRRILDWRPGLTSPASIEYRHEEEILSTAGDLETAYARSWRPSCNSTSRISRGARCEATCRSIFRTHPIAFCLTETPTNRSVHGFYLSRSAASGSHHRIVIGTNPGPLISNS